MSPLPPPYMINFGIPPYIKCQLIKEIHLSPYFVVWRILELNSTRWTNGHTNWLLEWIFWCCWDTLFWFQVLKTSSQRWIHTTRALNNCVGIVSLVFEMLCLFRATNKVLFKFRVMIINFVGTKILYTFYKITTSILKGPKLLGIFSSLNFYMTNTQPV